MSTKRRQPPSLASDESKSRRKKTPTFQVELPVEVMQQQAKPLQAHFEAGRQFYNAALSLGLHRLRRMRTDVGWNQVRAIPRTQKAERKTAFAALRENITLEAHRCKHGRLLARSLDTYHQTEPVLSRLWSVCQKTALCAGASVRLWDWPDPARSVFRVSGCLSRRL